MKTNLKVYTLTGAGTEIANFNVADTYEKYIIKGSATSIGNYAISITGTPQAGETFIVKYKGVLDITTNGNTFSILGQSLTQNQLISDLDIEAYYDGSAWIVEIKPSFTSSVVENTNLVNATVANSKLAQMAAYTIKANNTGSSAVPQDVNVSTLFNANSWSLIGNSGTSSSNFIGTTDSQPLYFRVNNDPAGFIDVSGTFGNTAFGMGTLISNTGGVSNTAIGLAAMVLNTDGQLNSALGNEALGKNTTGDSNVAIGRRALYWNETGNNNTCVGANANTTTDTNAVNRIALGYGAEADADFQFAIPDDVTTIKFKGIVYTLPTVNTDGVLTNTGGVLTWS